MSLCQNITDKLFNQCLNLIGNDQNQKKLRTNVIDPLVTYFKERLRFFFVAITLLLCLILIVNLCLIGQIFSLKSQVFSLSSAIKLLTLPLA